MKPLLNFRFKAWHKLKLKQIYFMKSVNFFFYLSPRRKTLVRVVLEA